MTSSKIKNMRIAGKILDAVFDELRRFVRPGIKKIDVEAKLIKTLDKYGIRSATKGLNEFPNYICISVNDEILFGRPDEKILNEGDLITLDLTINYKGFFVDKAVTFGLDPLRFDQKYIINAGKKCLENAISICKPNITTNLIGNTIYGTASYLKVKVIKDYGGHGIGLKPHNHPFIPNYDNNDNDTKLHKGMTFTIEPIVVYETDLIRSQNGVIYGDKISSHFEETILIIDNGAEVLTR